MQFQIRNKQNCAVNLNELDKIAAEFFGVEYDNDSWAKPKGVGIDWYNVVGYDIASLKDNEAVRQGNTMVEWRDVIGKIAATAAICTESMDDFNESFNAYKPFIELIYKFISLGYTAHAF
jgi:hypothetical protein